MQCNGRSPTRDRQGDGKHPGKDGEWSVAEGKQMTTDKGSKEKREVVEEASWEISKEVRSQDQSNQAVVWGKGRKRWLVVGRKQGLLLQP